MRNYEPLLRCCTKNGKLTIGNSTPLKRGTGSYVESLFTLLHLHHRISIPIIGTAYRQLDVLNITIPCSDYIKLFTGFFERETLAEVIETDTIDFFEYYYKHHTPTTAHEKLSSTEEKTDSRKTERQETASTSITINTFSGLNLFAKNSDKNNSMTNPSTDDIIQNASITPT